MAQAVKKPETDVEQVQAGMLAETHAVVERLIEHVATLTAQVLALEVGMRLRESTRLDADALQLLPGMSRPTFDLYRERVKRRILNAD